MNGSSMPVGLERAERPRIDWRLLLPVPPGGFEHLILLGGCPQTAERIMEVGLARRVSRDLRPGEVADAAAVLRGAGVGPEAVARHLRPGGAIYWEPEFERAFGIRMRREFETRLRHGGFSATEIYWVRPELDRSEQFLPFGPSRIMAWYLRNWGNDRSALRRLLIGPLANLTAAAMLGLRPIRHCVVTAVLGCGPRPIPSILRDPSVPEDARREGSHLLVINRRGRDDSRRVVVFAFPPGGRRPLVALKFSRLPQRNREVAEEQRVAAEIRAGLDEQLRDTIPAPLGTFPWMDTIVGVETCARGRLLSKNAPTRRRIEDLRLVTDWLIRFHRQDLLSRAPLSSAAIRRWIDAPLEAYTAAFGGAEAEDRLFDLVRNRAGALEGVPFPLVRHHCPLSELNICRRGPDISVTDWEGTEAGPAFMALLFFVSLWHHRSLRRSARLSDSVSSVFLAPEPDPLAQLALRKVDEYVQALSIDPRLLPVLLVLTWVHRALGRLERDRAYGALQADYRRGNRHAEVVEVLARHRGVLFAGEGAETADASTTHPMLLTQ